MIGESVDTDVGIIWFDFLRDGVDKLEQRGSWTSFGIVQSLACIAPAIVDAVILRNRDDRGFGMFLQPLAHAFDRNLEDVRI